MINHVYGLAVRALLSDENGKILILKRSTDSKTNPGKWELPGGKVNQEESFDHALLREVYEETGLKIELDHVVGVSEQNLHLIRAVHIIMSGSVMDGKLNLSAEHEGYAWDYFENLSDYELADWLEDFVLNQQTLMNYSDEIIKDKSDETNLKPWIKSAKKYLDDAIKKR